MVANALLSEAKSKNSFDSVFMETTLIRIFNSFFYPELTPFLASMSYISSLGENEHLDNILLNPGLETGHIFCT